MVRLQQFASRNGKILERVPWTTLQSYMHGLVLLDGFSNSLEILHLFIAVGRFLSVISYVTRLITILGCAYIYIYIFFFRCSYFI